MKNFKIENLIMLCLIGVFAFLPESALAQSTGGAKSQLSTLFLNEKFKMAIDFGLILFAGYQWFIYFNGFDPSKAFKDAIVPAVITWFAFNWTIALSWVGIINV